MKRLLLGSTLALLSLYSHIGLAKQAAESLDQIVAVVNDDIVTRSELNRNLNVIKMQMSQGNMPSPAANSLQKQALDQLINKKLQLQIAQQAGITISDNDLNQAISYIAKQNNMSTGELYSRINQGGMTTAEYKDMMRDQITLQKLQQQEVVGHLTVTEDEINAFMHTKVWRNNTIREYHVQDILIPFNDETNASEIVSATQQAQTVLAKLKQNPNADMSQDNVQTTDLGWRKIEEMPSLFTKQLAGMQAHDIAGPIEAPNGIHVIRLAEVRSAGGDIQAAPSRKQVEELLLQRKFAEAVQTWVSKQRGQAFIQTTLEA